MNGLTLALRDADGPVKVCGGVSRAGDAVILSELSLVGSMRTADATMN